MHRNNHYDGVLSDVWSSGVLLFSMVCGYLPFNEESEEENVRNILKGQYKLPDVEGHILSDDLVEYFFKNLISKLNIFCKELFLYFLNNNNVLTKKFIKLLLNL